MYANMYSIPSGVVAGWMGRHHLHCYTVLMMCPRYLYMAQRACWLPAHSDYTQGNAGKFVSVSVREHTHTHTHHNIVSAAPPSETLRVAPVLRRVCLFFDNCINKRINNPGFYNNQQQDTRVAHRRHREMRKSSEQIQSAADAVGRDESTAGCIGLKTNTRSAERGVLLHTIFN